MRRGRTFVAMVRMTGRASNLAILVLVPAALLTGGLAFAVGSGWNRAVTVAHAVVGLGLVVVAGWKQAVVRRGLRRRDAVSSLPSIVLGALVVTTVATGVLRSTGLVLVWGPLDDMQVHVGAALLSVPLFLWHAVARPTRPTRRDLSRRNLVRSGIVLGSAVALWGALEGATRAAGLAGGQRRFTGSYLVGRHDPSLVPRTTWLFDDAPSIASDEWRLTVTDADGVRRLAASDLPPRQPVTTTLDCTSGWWTELTWDAVPLRDLFLRVPAEAVSVVVVSATGYRRRFPLRDLDDLWLATGYEGEPLRVGHGAPARLVAPGRRGFWWVKWVTEVHLDDQPWWVQSPYPLQ